MLKKSILIAVPISLIIIVSLILFKGESAGFKNFDFIDNYKYANYSNFDNNSFINNINEYMLTGRYGVKLRYAITKLFSNPAYDFSALSNEPFILGNKRSAALRIKIKTATIIETPFEIHFLKNRSSYLRLLVYTYKGGRICLEKGDGTTRKVLREMNLNAEQNKSIALMLFFTPSGVVVLDDDRALIDVKLDGVDTSGSNKLMIPELKTGQVINLKIANYDPSITEAIDRERSQKYWAGAYIKQIYPGNEEAPKNMVHLYLNRLSRRSIAMPMDSSIRWEVEIPPKSRLDFQYIWLGNNYPKSKDVQLYLTIKNQGSVVISKQYQFSQPRRWIGCNVDLASVQDRAVEISFGIKSGSINDPEDILLFLANPVLRTDRIEKEKNILLIMLDTLRADHLSCYGYKLQTSPFIDSFANRSVLFENAISQSSWTLPAHLSLFSSKYPFESGEQIFSKKNAAGMICLSPNIETISEILKKNGYMTMAITGDAYVSASLGFDQGFEKFRETEDKFTFNIGMPYSSDLCIKWIKENKNNKWFMFYHTYEIHTPYRHKSFLSDESNGPKAEVIARYDSGIRFADFYVKKIIDTLVKNNLYDDTLIIITSDHGESFYDHRTGKPEPCKEGMHGHNMYDELLKIPLIMGGSLEFKKGKRISRQVRLIDIFPTILDYLDIEQPEDIRGESVLPIIDEKDRTERMAYAEAIASKENNEIKVLRTLKDKLIANYNQGAKTADYEYYDLARDPLEKNNTFNKSSSRIELLLKTINKIITSVLDNEARIEKTARPRNMLDTESLNNQLKALGYINQ